MSVLKCSHNDEVRELLMHGHWPEACGAELRAHVEGCRECGELVLVTQALRQAREVSAQRARLEPAGLIWWRAQLRKRQEAMERVGKPIWRAQIFAVVVSLSVTLGFVGWELRQGDGLRGWVDAGSRIGSSLFALKDQIRLLPMVVSVAMLLLLGGVVVWLTVERE